MLRLVIREDDAAMAANVGGHVQTTYRTFDVDLPHVEAWLTVDPRMHYTQRVLVGAEVLPVEPEKAGAK
jgi:hypothetical protein